MDLAHLVEELKAKNRELDSEVTRLRGLLRDTRVCLNGILNNAQPDSDSEYEDAKHMANCMSLIRAYAQEALSASKTAEVWP